MKFLVLLLLFAATLGYEDIDLTLGMTQVNPAASCHEIYQRNPTSKGSVGQYWIKTDEGVVEVTCNMKLNCGGVEGGWTKVVDIDMNRGDSCPDTWKEIIAPRKLCLGYVAGCASANFFVKGVDYQHICGQVKAYQKGSTDAYAAKIQSIDGTYVDGISITLGSPRKHVWTYAAGISDDHNYPHWNCPCATYPGPPPPAFTGNHYYCESGDVGTYELGPYYLSDPLWDGSGCGTGNGCCAQIGMPWFYRKLPAHVNDDFEIRICKSSPHEDEDIAVEKAELYVI